MNEQRLAAARQTAALIGTRVQLTLPSVLATGEPFSLRISVTGADALPRDDLPLRLQFEPRGGLEGLPAQCEIPTGASCVRIENLRATSPGAVSIGATIGRTDVATTEGHLFSNPAWIFDTPPWRIYFGDLHVHTVYSNCSGWRCLDPAWCYEYARDVSLLDFAAPADHLRGIAADDTRWPRLQQLAREFHRPGQFVSFLAFESSHAQGYGGDNNVYYRNDDAPYFWLEREDMKGIAPKVPIRDLWRWLDGNDQPYLTIPHHTGRAQKYRSWEEPTYDSQREPLFEIHSSWGSSEMRHSRLPISGGNNDAPAYFVDALRAGARFGVIASSDDHATLPGSTHHFRIDPYRVPTLNGHAHKGLAAIRASSLERGQLFDAMQRRETFATTHARSLLDLTLEDAGMGSVLPLDRQTRRERNLRLRYTLDGASGARVTLMRNGEPFRSVDVRGPELMQRINEVAFEDTEDFDRIALRDRRYHADPFVVYYARIEDVNGDHQWSSPIWIEGR